MRNLASPSLLRRLRDALVLSPLLTVAAGCTPTFAPPVRAVQSGAPGRLHAGEVEVGGTVAGVYWPTGGSIHVVVGLRDWVSVEGGGTFIMAPDGTEKSLMLTGWGGTRFTLPRRRTGVSLLLDAELGLGGGVGGESCMQSKTSGGTLCDADGLHWYNRGAFGGYEGGGIGFGYQWFSLYGRARIEESVAKDIPITYWPSASLGFGFDVAPRVSLDVIGGYLGYLDAKDSINGWFYQVGVSVRFGR